jgi:hypothetical protein
MDITYTEGQDSCNSLKGKELGDNSVVLSNCVDIDNECVVDGANAGDIEPTKPFPWELFGNAIVIAGD